MTSAFVLPRTRVLAVVVAATLLALVAWQLTAARPLNTSGATAGAGAGKVTQKPLTITHTLGGSSPEFLGAAATGERLTSLVINFSRTDRSGKEIAFYRVTLTNAFVSEVSQRSAGDSVLEDVSFIFQKIEQKSLTQNTTFIENIATGGA